MSLVPSTAFHDKIEATSGQRIETTSGQRIETTSGQRIETTSGRDKLENNSTGGHYEKVEWYNDPYELGARIVRMIEKGEESQALEMMKRHTGASNSWVYSRYYSSMNKAHKLEALEAFKKDFKKTWFKLEGFGYVSVLSLIRKKMASIPAGHVIERKQWLNFAYSVFDEIPFNPFLVNAMLQICDLAAPIGGWEIAQGIFEDLANQPIEKNQKDSNESHQNSSVISNAIMMRICGTMVSSGDMQGMVYGQDLWNQLNYSALSKAEMQPEMSQVVTNYIRLCSASHSPSDQFKAFPAIEHFYGLARRHLRDLSDQDLENEEFMARLAKKKSYPAMLIPSVEVLSILMRFAGRVNYPKLGQDWYDQVIEKYDIVPDEALMKENIRLVRANRAYHNAWGLAKQLKFANRQSFWIRICLDAALKNKFDLAAEYGYDIDEESSEKTMNKNNVNVWPHLALADLPPTLKSNELEKIDLHFFERCVRIYQEHELKDNFYQLANVSSMLGVFYIYQAGPLLLKMLKARNEAFIIESNQRFEVAASYRLSRDNREIAREHVVVESVPELLLRLSTLEMCLAGIENILQEKASMSRSVLGKFEKASVKPNRPSPKSTNFFAQYAGKKQAFFDGFWRNDELKLAAEMLKPKVESAIAVGRVWKKSIE